MIASARGGPRDYHVSAVTYDRQPSRVWIIHDQQSLSAVGRTGGIGHGDFVRASIGEGNIRKRQTAIGLIQDRRAVREPLISRRRAAADGDGDGRPHVSRDMLDDRLRNNGMGAVSHW